MRFTLQQLGLIDAPREDEYDNLTSLAVQLLKVPAAHVSILDRDNKRVVYKSQYGHSSELAQARELPMELTYCQHVALTQAPVIVPDSREHCLLKGTPAQKEGPLAYMGLPISTPDGMVVGGLCVMQPDQREWTDSEIDGARKLADSVSDLIRLKATLLTSERLRQEQREFTYAISHDLMSPVNTLHLILSEVAHERESLSADAQMLVSNGLGTVARMGRQVEDVLQYSHTNDGQAELETLSLNVLVEETLVDLKGLLDQSNARVTINELPDIIGNRMQFRSLFYNLIANALKFQFETREPVVDISSNYDEALAQHCIVVKDNGIGIAPEDQEMIFNLFARLHPQEKYFGSGIGLSLCQRVAENHGGIISVESDGTSGTTFSLVIPDSLSLGNESLKPDNITGCSAAA